MFANLEERAGDRKRALEANIKKHYTKRNVCHYLVKVSIQMVIEAQPETVFLYQLFSYRDEGNKHVQFFNCFTVLYKAAGSICIW